MKIQASMLEFQSVLMVVRNDRGILPGAERLFRLTSTGQFGVTFSSEPKLLGTKTAQSLQLAH